MFITVLLTIATAIAVVSSYKWKGNNVEQVHSIKVVHLLATLTYSRMFNSCNLGTETATAIATTTIKTASESITLK